MVALLAAALAGPGVALGDCPEPYELGAVAAFEDVLTVGDPAAEVAFADCLARLGLLHAAQRHYLEVVGSGDRGDTWNQAVDGAMVLVDHLGDPHSVLPYLRGVDPRRVGAKAGHDPLYFVNGQVLMMDGRYELAAVRLEEVSKDSRWYREAALLQARSLELAERSVAALELYEAVPDEPGRDEARIQRVVLLARLGRTIQALEAIEALRDTPSEGAVAGIRVQLLREQALPDEAQRAARDAIRLGRDTWIPEAELLAAEVAADGCRIGASQRHLARFHQRWDPIETGLDALVNVGRVDGSQVHARWIGGPPPEWGLEPMVVAAALDARPARTYLESHLTRVEAERGMVAAIDDPSFQAIVAPHLDAVLDDGERQLKYLIGHAVASRMSEMHEELVAHQEQAGRVPSRLEACRGPL